MTRYTTRSPEETRRLGADLARGLRPGDLLLLEGDVGSGKTTLLQGVVAGLGATSRATSPSFTIAREYAVPSGSREGGGGGARVFRHVDLYRLPDPSVDADRIGLPELLDDPEAIVAVEWADRLPFAVRRRARTIRFAHGRRPAERTITVTGGA